jgi:hypothetical protein
MSKPSTLLILISVFIIGFTATSALVIRHERAVYAESLDDSPRPWLVPGILVEPHPDTLARSFHVRALLTLSSEVRSVPNDSDADIPVRTWALRKALYLIPGITAITIYPYSLEIGIAPSYGWDEVEKNMQTAIQKNYMWITGEK